MSLPRVHGEIAKLWDDPSLRYTSGGKAVLSLPLVFTKWRKTDKGGWEEAGSLFVTGTAWEQFAENIAETVSKKDDVIVSGELSQREYERKDGSKGYALELAISAIGPNLKKHSARINRADRAAPPVDDPWGSAPATPVGDDAPF